MFNFRCKKNWTGKISFGLVKVGCVPDRMSAKNKIHLCRLVSYAFKDYFLKLCIKFVNVIDFLFSGYFFGLDLLCNEKTWLL